MPPHPTYVKEGIKPRVFCIRGKHSTKWALCIFIGECNECKISPALVLCYLLSYLFSFISCFWLPRFSDLHYSHPLFFLYVNHILHFYSLNDPSCFKCFFTFLYLRYVLEIRGQLVGVLLSSLKTLSRFSREMSWDRLLSTGHRGAGMRHRVSSNPKTKVNPSLWGMSQISIEKALNK